jgi:hypothetical protein
MYTFQQFRARAAEYAALVKTASSPDERLEFEKLERSFITLAENEEWVATHTEQTVHMVDPH